MASIFNRKKSITENSLLNSLEIERRRSDRLEIEKLWFQYAKGNQIHLDYSAVSIYGAGSLGIKLYRLLCDNNIPIVCFIDRKPVDEIDSIKVCRPDAELPYTDLMIVTAVYDYWDIRHRYVSKGINVVSIMDILNEVAE